MYQWAGWGPVIGDNMAGQRVRGAAKAADINFGALLGRQLFPLLLVALLFWLGREHLPTLNFSEIWKTFQNVRADQWIIAGLATGASFWAVGRYDSVLHGLMGTGISQKQAHKSGASAIAVAQFAGFGIITGALVRWHLLPGLSLARAFRISFAVSLSFLAGWAVIASGAILWVGLDTPRLEPMAWLVLAIAGITAVLAYGLQNQMPGLPTIKSAGKILGLVILDTGFAALALYALLPVGIEIPLSHLFTVYLIALGAGLVGSTPGGVGPFELCLLALLPAIPDGAILASALAFRLIYYAVPAVIGLVILIVGTTTAPAPTLPRLGARQNSSYLHPTIERLLWCAPRAEANLIRQGDFSGLMMGNEPIAIAAPVGQNLVMLGDPLFGASTAARSLQMLDYCAKQNQRTALVYKCCAQTAVTARRHGWRVLPVAREATVNPQSFTLDGANLRQLRRSLRRAEKAGVCVTEAGRELPLDEMQAVSQRWSVQNGGENGFSMGVFRRDYVSCQRVFLAHAKGKLVGFATFHESRAEWCLDLMRQEDNAPAGTMHLLIRRAIQSAADVQCSRLSLAAIPSDGPGDAPALGILRQSLLKRRDFSGLKRFKSSFDPRWETRYALARSWFSMLHGLFWIYHRINKPG